MARVFTLPSAYRRRIEAAIAIELASIARDAKARAEGRPVINTLFDPDQQGEATIIVADLPSDEEQLRDEMWPEEPMPDQVRFPQVPQVNTNRKRQTA